MEPDRYSKNEVAYIVGIICLMVSLALFALSFYIFPNLALGWHYELPEFIPLWRSALQESYQLSETAASWFLFFSFFFPALFLAVIADILSHRIDSKIAGLSDRPVNPPTRADSSANRLIIKIFGIIVLVFVAAQFFQWVISSSPATI